MKQKKSKIILVAVTVFPLISYILMYVLGKVYTIHGFSEELPDYTLFEKIFAFFSYFTPFLGFTLAFFYLFLILRNDTIRKVKKIFWLLSLVIPKVNIVFMLLYLYLHERTNPPEALSTKQT